MSGPEFDAVIAGGGLSGLSLAAHLATAGWQDRAVLVVDDAARRPAATSWGFWSAAPDLLDAAVSRSYRRVRVHAAGRSSVLPLGGYHYRVVRRPDLERVVRGLLAGCPRFALSTGRVEAVRDDGDAAEVVVDGRPIRTWWAFDSVTPPPHGPPVDAWLAFTGWEIHSRHDRFDPDTPTLFDFRTPQTGGARFCYLLPEDARHALVELTEFVPRGRRPPDGATRRAALAGYLRDIVGCDGYTVARTESSVLPLRIRPPGRRSGRVLAIGARGGLVKASTGYAYQRIQRDSAAIARSLVRHGHPYHLPGPRRRHRLLDAVLLDVFERDPPRLEQAFARLFAANPADRVLRFLDEDSGPPDDLRLMVSLAAAPYLRALLHRLWRGSRAAGRPSAAWPTPRAAPAGRTLAAATRRPRAPAGR